MMVRIASAQALSLVREEETLQQLSVPAETLIVAARDWLYAACCKEWGTPCNAEGQPQPLLILDGKAGRRRAELLFRYRSDLCPPEHGATRGGRRELDNAQFFTRPGSGLSRRSISRRRTALFIGGYAPAAFGDSGPLVLSFAALEDYYREQGRDWECYAMVKARIMGDNDGAYASELRAMLRPSSSAAISTSA